MDLLRILIGLAVLTTGRQLFWLFVGATGFMLGLYLGPRFFADQPDWLILLIAVSLALVGVAWAIIMQRLIIGVAGFLAGGLILLRLLTVLNWDARLPDWAAAQISLVIIGGVIGAILVSILFDWSLIILSSLIGAGLIVEALGFEPLISLGLFAGLVIAGALIQAGMMRRSTVRRSGPLKRPPER